MSYRIASSQPRLLFGTDGQPTFAPPLHAYLNGTVTTVCGLALITQAYMHTMNKWADRPKDMAVCLVCAVEAGR